MKSLVNSKKYKKVLRQVPANYYAKGVKTNLLQKIWHTNKWSHLEQFLVGINGKLLDIGCADGTTTNQIKKRFAHLEITGVDFYKDALKFAKRSYQQIDFIHADAHRLPFRRSSFDTVTTIEVLEHMHEIEQVIKEIYRVLKPKGSLIIVQDTDSILFKVIWWFWTKWKGSVWTESHISCMKPKKLMHLLRQNGFAIKKYKFVNLRMEIFIKAQKNQV